MTNRPWSAKREEMWRQITFSMASLALVMTVTALVGKIASIPRLVAASLPTAISLGIVSIGCWVMWVAERSNPNRPAGDHRRLTPWKFWPAHHEAFGCDCGNLLSFLDATWSPNEGRQGTDPGGGRWCIVCPHCHRGHYKFNVGFYTGTGAKDR